MTKIENVVAWTAYPALMALCLCLHNYLLRLGFDMKVSSYVPVVCGALAITLLEIKFSHRKEWNPDGEDVFNDAVFMATVQVVLPALLTILASLTLVEFLNSRQLTLDSFWPHHWPAWLQAGVMVLCADFFRYWLHRIAHEWPLLWRFHAVHHSPPKLYWVNVARFHPVDKCLQFLFDALPFIVLGVGEEVLALYMVFYSVNGFFQHCNIDIRLGLLNYIISGPELHRWHHSKIAEISNQNYGNNLIIWDSLFGTRFLPKEKQVGTLGLPHPRYPMKFLAQMKTPFIKGIEQA